MGGRANGPSPSTQASAVGAFVRGDGMSRSARAPSVEVGELVSGLGLGRVEGDSRLSRVVRCQCDAWCAAITEFTPVVELGLRWE